MNKLPLHVAIIMDGNGRWARERNLPRVRGHQAGVDSIRDVVRAAGEMGIRYLTLYAFSTENWARPKEEVSFLMNLLSEYLDKELQEMTSNNVRLNIIGRIEDLPEEVRDKLKRNLKETEKNTGLVLMLALSYSSRVEIVDAVRVLAEKARKGAIMPENITLDVFADHLYTRGIPDPDLLIRTSGEMRISNFLLWQLSYTEIVVTEKLWPDFRRTDFVAALEEFAKRERRFGRTETCRQR